MFPYLRTAEEFLEDCTETGYGIVEKGKKAGNGYKIVPCEPNGQCQYVDDKSKDAFHDDSASGFKNCKECKQMPRLVGWLTQRVNHANWGEDLRENGVGNVKFGEIATWCQSVCKHMRKVINGVNKKTRENLCIGIEYYLENNFEVEGTGTRLDMMIGGYGIGENENNNPVMKIIVVELKGFYDDDGRVEDAWSQLEEYCQNLNTSINWEDDKDNIEIIPVLFCHNLGSDKIASPKVYKKIKYTKSRITVDGEIFCKEQENDFGKFIKDTLNCKGTEPKKVFKEMRQRYRMITIDDQIDLLNGNREKYEEYLRPDQRHVYNELRMHIILNRIRYLENRDNFFNEIINWFENHNCNSNYPISGKEDFQNLEEHEKILASELINNCRLKEDGLVNVLKAIINKNDNPCLNAYQQNIYSEIREYVTNGKKPIDIIHGGPGSGKTLIVYLLARYCKDSKIDSQLVYSRWAQYGELVDSVSDHKFPCISPKQVHKFLDDDNKTDDAKFKVIADKVVLYDEGHRFIDVDNEEETTIEMKIDAIENVFEGIINKSGCTMIFFDEKQKIEKTDQGINLINTIESSDIRKVMNHYLWTQFRCGKDEGYVSWIEQVLEIDNSDEIPPFTYGKTGVNNAIYLSDLDFEPKIQYYEKIEDIKRLDDNSRKNGDACYVKRVINNFNIDKIRPWSAKEVQGVEFEEVVVIIDEKVLDKTEEVKNAYRLLMTRGMEKCYIYIKKGKDNKLYKRMKAYTTRRGSKKVLQVSTKKSDPNKSKTKKSNRKS